MSSKTASATSSRPDLVDVNALPLSECFAALNPRPHLERLLTLAFEEDMGRAGDITTQTCGVADQPASANLTAREAGVIAGLAALPILFDVFRCTDLKMKLHMKDGDRVKAQGAIATIEDSDGAGDLLAVERTMLNLLCRLSGIATLTKRFTDQVADAKARICDTRKTTPGLRGLEKYAVRCGGGYLHRVGLYDAILIKDNHLIRRDRAVSLTAWLNRRLEGVREKQPVQFVEVEVDSLEMLEEVLACRPGLIDIILLDNMTPEMLKEAVAMRDKHAGSHGPHGIALEASGGVSLDTVRAMAQTGVERISIGALTHSAPILDIGLDFIR